MVELTASEPPAEADDQPSGADGRDPQVTFVAVASLAAGLACTLAPGPAARLAGIDAPPVVMRTIGLTDLTLAAGLFAGRRSWPWMAGRAASNPAIAAVCLTSARSGRGRLVAATLVALTAVDLRTAVRLRRAGR